MKIRETRDIPATTREVVAAIVCDLCGRKKPGDGWEAELFDVDEVKVSYESGKRYPEGNFTEIISYDICPNCFKGRLMRWLESQGAEPTREDRNW